MIDTLVIGAGLSGLMAAYAVAKNGRSVKLITKGLGGALHWSAGTVDLLGYLSAQPEQPVLNPLAVLDRLPETHPYNLISPKQAADALKQFALLSQEIGLPYETAANSQENLLLPSPVGAMRPTFLAPAGMIAGDLRRPEPLLIVGFKGLRDFYPELIAENLSKQGHPARAVHLSLELITSRRDSSPVNLAEGLEATAVCHQLARALKPHVQPGERVGFPAILGMGEHTAVLHTLASALRAPVFEIPTLPPSIPGMRLFTALRHKLRAMGVRVEVGMEVISANVEEGEVIWVASETSARPLRHRARHFVLATGGILGGGIMTDGNGRVWESIFDLPLTVPQQRSNWFRASFLNPQGHPLFHGGVCVNGRFQPVRSDGTAVYNNLWAVGNTLAHCDPIQERSLEGIGIITGLTAGKAVTEQLKISDPKKNLEKKQTADDADFIADDAD